MWLTSHFRNVTAFNLYVSVSSLSARPLARRSLRARLTPRSHDPVQDIHGGSRPWTRAGECANRHTGLICDRSRDPQPGPSHARAGQRWVARRCGLSKAGAPPPRESDHGLRRPWLCRYPVARTSLFQGARPRTSCRGSTAGRTPARHRHRQLSGSAPACCAHHRSRCRPCHSPARSGSS